jgi:catechol 2,3-dioxygenase-like lactoylglutathione lyase family enzyme
MPKSFIFALALIFPGFLSAQKAVTERPAITGISHATFYADDLPKSEAFYGTLLGWDQVPATGAQSGVRFYANHLQYIELLPPPSQGLADRLDSIGFLTGDAEALRKYLAANGVAVPEAITVEQDGSRSFLTHDPEGNKIEFTQPGSHSPRAPKSASQRLSTHIIHAGLVAHDRTVLDHFYQDLLGFHLYWQGGAKPDHMDWVMMQVPNGTDWLEYMLYLPADPSRGQLAGANHFAPGVVSVAELQKKLIARGWKPTSQEKPPSLAFDGKWQLDLFDPDGTRVEFMEFHPVRKPCCAPFTGPQPDASPAW